MWCACGFGGGRRHRSFARAPISFAAAASVALERPWFSGVSTFHSPAPGPSPEAFVPCEGRGLAAAAAAKAIVVAVIVVAVIVVAVSSIVVAVSSSIVVGRATFSLAIFF